ncbi:MAG: glycosyltransferase family 1 protein [Gemmatimonadaceae bacterium]
MPPVVRDTCNIIEQGILPTHGPADRSTTRYLRPSPYCTLHLPVNEMEIGERRIALFTGAYDHIADGVSLTLNRLVRHLLDRGAAVRVFAPAGEAPAIDHSGDLITVPSIAAPGRPEYRISTGIGRAASRELTAFKPNLFHVATPDLLGLRALRLASSSRTPLVSSYHTHFASYLQYYRLGALQGFTWRYLRWFYSRCRQVYVPTQSMLNLLADHGVRTEMKIWPRGVDSTRFNPARRSMEWRQSVGIEHDEVVVLFVSRLVMEKGLDVLGDVLAQLSQRGVRHRALIVGDGPERGNLEHRLPNAIFTGTLGGDELATAYASSELFFFPSETETFGNVTLEALASGLPAVVANATGSKELVEEGRTGYLASARDTSTLASRVEELIQDTSARRRFSAAATAAAQRYEWPRVLDKLVSYYAELPS